MKRILMIGMALAACCGCSREDREEAIGRMSKAARELSGSSDSVSHAVPKIVAEQQRMETVRQNTQWTKENQAQHPVEYCQAQLEELKRLARCLVSEDHSLRTAKAAIARKQGDERAQGEGLDRMVKEAKRAYRAADAANEWPMKLNGFNLTKDRAEQKIVDAVQRISALKASVKRADNQITVLEKKLKRIEGEQKRLVALREKVEAMITDLKTRQVVESANGVADSLNSIADSMASLGTADDDVRIEDLAMQDDSEARKKAFVEIMSEE